MIRVMFPPKGAAGVPGCTMVLLAAGNSTGVGVLPSSALEGVALLSRATAVLFKCGVAEFVVLSRATVDLVLFCSAVFTGVALFSSSAESLIFCALIIITIC